MPNENGSLPEMMTRRAAIKANSFNAETRTIEAVISTFASVQRRDSRGAYEERLDPAGLDITRLVGAPVLDGHRQDNASAVLGVVESGRFDRGNLLSIIRLSSAADAESAVTRIIEGTLQGVSIGYRGSRWIETIDPVSKSRVRTAAAWQIFEVSAVPVPADPGATFRSNDMTETIETTAEPTVAETRAEIRKIGRAANMSVEAIDDMIDRDLTPVEARSEAFEAMQARSRQTPTIRVVNPGQSPADTRAARTEALTIRMNGGTPSEAARPFMGETLRDMARASVEATGQSTRSMDPDSLFRAAMHTTSDFSQLLTGAGNRTLVAAYQAAQSPLKALARQSTMADFRTSTRLKLSDIGLLEKVAESGEIKSTTRGEAAESYKLDTYATMFSLSRPALINDDLGAFRDWGNTAGRMAAETEANLLWTLLKSNPIMGEDGKRLFSVDHKNLAAVGAEPSTSELDTARRSLRGMTALDGKTPINAVGKYLLVGPALESTAEQLLASIYAATVGDVNPFSNKLTLLVDARIKDGSWYIFADSSVLPVLEYSYLSSAPGPQMSSREGWDVLGQEYRVVLDFGAGAIDWRGAYKNPGL